MKALQIILIVVAIILLGLSVPPAESAASKPLAEALVAYRQNPSPENKANLDHVREVRCSAHLRRAMFFGSLLAADLVVLFYVSRQSHRQVVT
jgi:hypothetical protein